MKLEKKMEKYNILIIDDILLNNKLLEAYILLRGDYSIYSSQSIQKALKILTEEKIDIICMDINLGKRKDGIDYVKEINVLKKIPIIYISSDSSSNTIKRAMETNVFGFIIKPFNPKDIEIVLNLTIKQNYLAKKKRYKKDYLFFTQLPQDYRYYAEKKLLFHQDKQLLLTKKESKVFYYLFQHINQTVSYQYLLNHVWDNKPVSHGRMRDTMLNLRKKVSDLNIKTIHSIGYLLEC